MILTIPENGGRHKVDSVFMIRVIYRIFLYSMVLVSKWIYLFTVRTEYLLTQLRTGHNRLFIYRKNVGYSDDDQCVCGAQETVTHALQYCSGLPKLEGSPKRVNERSWRRVQYRVESAGRLRTR
jgi:hypothetical protein